jgi:hypothetical protein
MKIYGAYFRVGRFCWMKIRFDLSSSHLLSPTFVEDEIEEDEVGNPGKLG